MQQFCRIINIPFEKIEIIKIQYGSVIITFTTLDNIDIEVVYNNVMREDVIERLERELKIFLFSMGKPNSNCNKLIFNADWNRTYSKNHTYWKGDLDDGKDRGKQPYYCPIGWKRLSLLVQDCETAENFYKKFEGWAIAYHGTKFAHGLSILLSGLKPARRGAHGRGIYLTPSIIYASHPRYSEVKEISPEYLQDFSNNKNAKYIQFVLECRVNIDHLKKKSQK